LIVAASSTLTVQAASSDSDRWFDVELLVFKRNVDIHHISEQLNQQHLYLKQRDRLEVFQAPQLLDCADPTRCIHQQNPVQITQNEITDSGHRIKLLDESHLQLIPEREKLAAHELFRPLMHVAFRMPIQNKKKALPIHLFAGRNYALDIYKKEISALQAASPTSTLDNPQDSDPNSSDKLDVLASLQKQKTIQDLYEIDGNLLIYVERYLYVDGQLIVRTETEDKTKKSSFSLFSKDESSQDTSADVEIAPTGTFIERPTSDNTIVTETLFDQKRRLRSEEIHYLDHPLFGIIVQIRKIPEKELAVLNAESAENAKPSSQQVTITH